MSKKSSSSSLGRSQQNNNNQNVTTYSIAVKTTDTSGASLTSKVAARLFGANGSTDTLSLTHSVNHAIKFQQGKTDVFFFPDQTKLGDISKVKIWHDNTGSDPNWHLSFVEVCDMTTSETFVFHCNKWLSKKFDDKHRTRDLVLSEKKTKNLDNMRSRAKRSQQTAQQQQQQHQQQQQQQPHRQQAPPPQVPQYQQPQASYSGYPQQAYTSSPNPPYPQNPQYTQGYMGQYPQYYYQPSPAPIVYYQQPSTHYGNYYNGYGYPGSYGYYPYDCYDPFMYGYDPCMGYGYGMGYGYCGWSWSY